MTIVNSARDFAPTRASVAVPAFRPSIRIQESLLANGERDLLRYLCQRMPSWVTPDGLTAVGVTGAVVTAVGYIAANFSPAFLFLASFGIVVNWFGDSLDGSVARFRNVERPRYGLFLDHSMDALSNLIISVGLGLSPYVEMGAALFTLVGYLLLGLSVFLYSHVSGNFRLSFLGCGPTELRLVMVAFNFVVYLMGPVDVHLLGRTHSLHSLSVTLLGCVLVVLFVVNVVQRGRDLAREA